MYMWSLDLWCVVSAVAPSPKLDVGGAFSTGPGERRDMPNRPCQMSHADGEPNGPWRRIMASQMDHGEGSAGMDHSDGPAGMDHLANGPHRGDDGDWCCMAPLPLEERSQRTINSNQSRTSYSPRRSHRPGCQRSTRRLSPQSLHSP